MPAETAPREASFERCVREETSVQPRNGRDIRSCSTSSSYRKSSDFISTVEIITRWQCSLSAKQQSSEFRSTVRKVQRLICDIHRSQLDHRVLLQRSEDKRKASTDGDNQALLLTREVMTPKHFSKTVWLEKKSIDLRYLKWTKLVFFHVHGMNKNKETSVLSRCWKHCAN